MQEISPEVYLPAGQDVHLCAPDETKLPLASVATVPVLAQLSQGTLPVLYVAGGQATQRVASFVTRVVPLLSVVTDPLAHEVHSLPAAAEYWP